MIKFFRKIRQKLLFESKFRKYLVYAIGEIILVMIGILLAIQANQWKQSVNQRKLEVKLLKEVQIGMQSDSTDVHINLNVNGHIDIYNSQVVCIDWLNGNIQNIPADSLTHFFSKAFKTSTFLVTKSPFDALKEFGLNNITNDSLKKEIQFLYDVLYPEYKRALNFYYSVLERTLDKSENYFEDWSWWGSKMKPYNIDALKNDKTFLFALCRLRTHNAGLIYYNLELLKRQRKILEMLDDELQGVD